MPRGSSTRSAMGVTPITARVPTDPSQAPSRSGRQRTLTEKQHQNGTHLFFLGCVICLTMHHPVIDQATKEIMLAKKTYTKALRARQKNEEFTGYNRDDADSLGAESEDDSDLQLFTSITVDSSTPDAVLDNTASSKTPPVKTTYRNGKRLVHRVSLANQVDEPEPVSH